MKKKINLILLLLFLSTGINNSALSQWNLNGNIIGAGNYLGTQNGFPLQLRTDLAQAILFQTNGINERMRITPTGLVSVSNGLNAPLSLLHVNSNGNTIGGELFRTSGPANQTNAWRMFTEAGNGTERFSIFVPTNSNNAILRTNVSDASSPRNFC